VNAEARTDTPSLSVSVGVSLAIGALGAALAVVPALSRVTAHGVSFVSAWLVLAGSTALLAGPAAAALRIARPLPRQALSPLLGIALAAAPLVLFARLLKVATHHRPLGAATYAIIAAGVILGATAFAARLIAWSGEGSSSLRRRAPLVVLGLALAAVAALSLRALAGELVHGAVHAALCLAVIVIAAFIALPPRVERLAARAGLALWVVLVLGSLLAPAQTRAAAASGAPVFSGFAGWFRAAR
jgi:hypothetical protein